MSNQPTELPLTRIEAPPYGTLALPAEHTMTVETRLGSPTLLRYMFDYTIVAVTGGDAVDDVTVALESTFANYRDMGGEWSTDIFRDDANEMNVAVATRRAVGEFTWASKVAAMVSVIACLSDDTHSMIVHGSCTVSGGDVELARLRAIVASAELPVGTS